MKKLLSLPQNLVDSFHDITNNPRDEWFCTSDPVDQKLGSGGGTAWLLKQAYKAETDRCEDFEKWLGREKRLLLHAGGQSRRLPAYAGVQMGNRATSFARFTLPTDSALSKNNGDCS